MGGGTARWDLGVGVGRGGGVTQQTTKRGYLALHNNNHLPGLATLLDSRNVQDRAWHGMVWYSILSYPSFLASFSRRSVFGKGVASGDGTVRWLGRWGVKGGV